MAKQIRKHADSERIICTPLQDHVPVNYKVVGTAAWLRGAWETGALSSDQIMVVDNLSVLDEVRDDLLSRRVLGVDTETTGPYMAGDKRYSLSPWNPGTRMVLAQIGTEDMTYLLEPDLVPEFKDILESESILHLLHNGILETREARLRLQPLRSQQRPSTRAVPLQPSPSPKGGVLEPNCLLVPSPREPPELRALAAVPGVPVSPNGS